MKMGALSRHKSRTHTVALSQNSNTRFVTHHPVKRKDEAALGILLSGCAVAAVSPALQVIKSIVCKVQHRSLIRCLLPASAAGRFNFYPDLPQFDGVGAYAYTPELGSHTCMAICKLI